MIRPATRAKERGAVGVAAAPAVPRGDIADLERGQIVPQLRPSVRPPVRSLGESAVVHMSAVSDRLGDIF